MKFKWGSVGKYYDNDPKKGIEKMVDIVSKGPIVTPKELVISLIPVIAGLATGGYLLGRFSFQNGVKAFEQGEFNTLCDLGIIKD
jgi:hypothetical protein